VTSAALGVAVFADLLGAVLVRPELLDAGLGEDRITEEVVIVSVGVHDDQGQRGLLTDGVQDFLALPRPAPGVDHHGPLGPQDQAGIELGTFSRQHIVVRADVEPS
jgi:hypothetical protein